MTFRGVWLIGVCLVFSLQAFMIYSPEDDNLTKILSKFREFVLTRPQEKLYLHTDKDIYVAGEDIWFSAYLTDAAYHKPDSISKTIYTELFTNTGRLVQRRVIYSPGGFSHGDFHLPDTLSHGKYIIRGYTNYMKNTGEDFFFSKEISVVNLGKTQRARQSSKRISTDVQFFPVGGDLLEGVENMVAFKAVDQNGNSVDVEGDILDEKGKLVVTFKSEHHGMGLLRFIPFPNHNYTAKIKNSDHFFALPVALQNGYLLRVTDAGGDIKVTAYSNLKKFSTETLPVYLVAQTRGIVCYAAKGEIMRTALSTRIPKRKFPTGIAQITLFDAAGIPQCERLFFINHQDALKLELKPDQITYDKKKAATIDLKVARKDGTPAKGSFSISVIDDTRFSSHKFPHTIVEQLLLTSDLKGLIEEPGYYFQDTSQQTKSHLDLLMMTHGWRRFTWKTVLQDIPDPLQYYAENGIVVSGKVLKSLSKKPSANSEVKIFTEQKDILILKTDNLGKFYADNLLLMDSSQLMFQTDNAKGKQSDLQFFLDPFNTPPALNYTAVTSGPAQPDSLSFLIATKNNPMTAHGKTTVLKEVEVKATRIKSEDNSNSAFKLYGIPDQTINMKDIPQGYTNILQAIQGRVAGVVVMGNTVSIRGGGEPLFLLNGMQVDLAMITNTLSISDIESIDILKGVSASIYGMRGGNGVIAIYTKKGYAYHTPATGIHILKYPGYYKAREFYTPRYDIPGAQPDTLDIRNTLYWNPAVKTTSAGTAHVQFFTSDISSHYKIIVEGISEDGTPGSASAELIVE